MLGSGFCVDAGFVYFSSKELELGLMGRMVAVCLII